MKALIHDEAFAGHLQRVLEEAECFKVDKAKNKLTMAVVIGIAGSKQATLLHVAPCPCSEEGVNTASRVAQHGVLISRMLPGGVDILGVSAIGPSALFEKAKPEVKQALADLHKVLAQTPQLNDFSQRVMLHIDSASLKMTSRLIDMSNPSGNGSPQDVKIVKNCTAFTELASDLVLQSQDHVPEEVTGQSVHKQMAAYTAEIESILQRATILIGGQRYEESAQLSLSLPAAGDDNDPVSVEFVLKQPTVPSHGGDGTAVGLSGAGAQVLVRGSVHLRALLPPRATYGEAVAAIRQDAVRSLQARREMHCEDLELIEDEQRDPSLRHELPKRVFLKRDVAPSTVPFCDYVYHGDDPEGCLMAFDEILGLKVQVGDIDQDEETSPAGETRQAEEAAQVEEMMEEMIHKGANQLRKDPVNVVIVVALSVCVALLAVLFGYMLLRQ